METNDNNTPGSRRDMNRTSRRDMNRTSRRDMNRTSQNSYYRGQEEEERRRKARRRKAQKIRKERQRRMRIMIIAGIVLFALLVTLIFKITHRNSSQELIPETEALTESTETTAVVTRPENSISLIMVGDILLHDDIEKLALLEDDTYDYTTLFSGIKETVLQSDLALVNEEVIIGGAKLGVSGYPKFNAPYELADELVETGFNVILQATNHANDMGSKGIKNCIENWNSKYPDIAVLGIHETQEDADDNIYVFEKNGIRIAILNYTQLLNQSLSSSKSFMVDRLLDEDKIRSDIQKAKEEADFVIVCPHWGTEYHNDIDSDQEKWTQVFLEEGVDLVIGTHPHVIEKVEMVTDESTGHQMLVYYSLGNFISWINEQGTEVQKRVIGGMAEVTIGKLDDGSAGILSYGVEPLICQITADKQTVTVYPYSDYSEDRAENSLAEALTGDFSIQYIDDYCDKIWGNLWRQ